jgi:hypothetical protein
MHLPKVSEAVAETVSESYKRNENFTQENWEKLALENTELFKEIVAVMNVIEDAHKTEYFLRGCFLVYCLLDAQAEVDFLND